MSQQWPLEKPHRLLFEEKKSPVYLEIHTFFPAPPYTHLLSVLLAVLISVVLNPRSPGPLSGLTGMVASSNQP